MTKVILIDFHHGQLMAFERPDGIYIALRPIVEGMGLQWRAQIKRIKRDPILTEGASMMETPFDHHGQAMLCLRLELIHGWLFSIDHSRIKDPAVRERVLIYKRECYQVLFEHFYGARRGAAGRRDQLKEDEWLLLRKIAECRLTFGARAAAELWLLLDMERVPSMFLDPRQHEMFTYQAIRRMDDPGGQEAV